MFRVQWVYPHQDCWNSWLQQIASISGFERKSLESCKMRVTNKYGLPKVLENVLHRDPYTKGASYRSATQLGDSPPDSTAPANP